MRFVIRPSHDKPVDVAVLLGHDKIIENLKKFLESDTMITPISVAVHGEWGSGKTSIMKTLGNKLDPQKLQVIFFEPWRYENSDPPLALAQLIANRLDQSDQKTMAKELIILAANSISKKFLGIELDNFLEYVERNTQDVTTFSHQLERAIKGQLGNKKLIIIIDDLDRCSIENTLLILAIMKLFLEIENCICIAAVDFKRLQQAWKLKYQVENESDGGREYLEKIFQIRIGLPVPSSKEIMEYEDTCR
jgi:predicted KAP-like P-loop ATPase